MTLTSRSRFLIRFTVLAALAIGIVMLALSSTGSNTVGAQQGTVPDKPTGVVVTATHDSVSLTWEDPADSTITHYQIFRRDRAVHDPGEFVEIDSNTGSAATSYTDDTVEPETRYVYRMKAVNQHGASTWSNFVQADTPAAPTPEPDQNSPATGQPTIGGTVEVGETLTADTSGIVDADGLGNAVFEYQWLAENTEVAGATGSTYTPVDADVGKTIKVRVSFTDDRDFEESLTSEATESVAAAATSADDGAIWSATMTVGIANGNSGFSAYTDLGELTPTGFTLNGTEYLVKILGESDGQFYFALNPDVQNDFRLHVGEAQFASEDASIQTKVVRGSVVAYIYQWDPGTLSLSDGDTVEVGLTSANTPATGAPTISGDAYVGETLTADVSAIDDADGLGNPGYGYQWVRYDETTDSDITGANSSTYTLVEDDADNAIKVRVSFTDDDYNPEELTSGATAAVEPAPLTTETSDEPESHNGTDAFTFRIAFSEDISISYTVFRDHSFETTNGSITRARRVNGSSSLWEITVEPDSDADVTVVLPVTTDCTAQGAVCTSDGRKLSNSVELTIAGPRGSGAVYTYEDSDRTLRVILQEDLVVRQTGSDVPTDRMVRRTAGGSIVRGHFLYGAADLPVFRSPSGGGLMTLPGGVLLALDPEWDAARVERFFVENNIAQALISERDYMPNGFFVDTEPGFPSLELANTLAAQKGVVLSIPNWWLELGTRQDPGEPKGDDREAAKEAVAIEPRNEGIDDAYDLPLDGSFPGTINPYNDIDFFKLDLSGQAGTTDVRIYTTGAFNTIGALYDDSTLQQWLMISDNAFGSDNFSLLASLPQGVYYVLVLGHGGLTDSTITDTGSYTLYAETVTATSVSLGSSVDANIDTAGEVDYFRLDLSETTDVSLFTVSSDWAPRIEGSLGSGGILSNRNFFGDATMLVHRSTEGLAADSHLFAVWGADGDTGDYSLHAQAVPDHGSTTDDATTLSLLALTSGKLTSASDAEYFKLVLGEPKALVIMAFAGVDVVMLDSGGTAIQVHIERDDDGFNKIIDDFESGTYYVKITATGASSYALYAYEDAYEDTCSAATSALADPTLNDPLYACQWHLNSDDSAGMDINVESVWDDSITGEGINVVVVDETIDYSHPDLIDNIDMSLNHDYGEGYIPSEDHGTNVAGVIAARNNTIGVRGVAPMAAIYGYNLLAGGGAMNEDIGDAMSRNHVVTAVSNNSWGPTKGKGFGSTDTMFEMAIDEGVTEGYYGKGVFYVFAGGNGGGPEHGDNSNRSEFGNYYGVTAVCAVGENGRRATYSEEGANLWICAPTWGDVDGDGLFEDDDRGTATTKNSGYGGFFNGTSAAAPMVSGVAALLRQANTDLTWRDLKLILAASARKNDSADTGWEDGARKYGSTDGAESYHFNHQYGFGIVDADEAVALAQDWSLLPLFLDASSESSTLDTMIPDNTASGITHSLTLDTEIDFIEFVEVEVSIDHVNWRELKIEIVSPSGATSLLAVSNSTATDVSVPDKFRFGSAKHLGEDPNGTWMLKVVDEESGNEGTFEDWSITVYGHAANSAPAFASDTTTRSVAENTASGANVGSAVTATDADGDTLTYTLGGTDAASFSIVGASGQIQTSAALDYEQKTSYSVTVSVADGEGGTDTIGVTINVTDVNEKPDAPGAPTVTATSNTTTSLDVSWTAPGLNGGPALTGYEVRYRISGSWIDWTHSGTGTSATITGLTASTTYDVQVRALNGETPSDWSSTGTGSTGTPANNAPEFSDGASTTRSVAENTASGANVGSAVTATDADGDTLTYTLGGTDAASFSIVGASGQIQTSAALDYEQKTSYSVTVSVADGEGGTDTIGVTINVTDVNEKPDAPGAPTVTATSNTTTSLDVSWTAPGLNGGPALTGYEVRYRISGSWIDWTHSGTGTSATITGLTASTTYDVQVRALNGETPSDWSSTGTGSTGTPANNAPEFSDGASTTRSVAENTASGANVGSAVTATDADGDTLTYTLGGTDAASFSIVGASGQIQTSAALDYEQKTSYSVTVSVADGEGGTDTIGVTINVTDVNEKPDAPGAPTVTATSNTTTSLDVSWTAPGLNGGPALTGYEVRYRISGSWIDWTHSGTGTSATITGLTASTTYDVQVRALNGETPSDWSSTGTGSTGTPANNAPEFSDGASTARSVAENTASSSNVGSAVTATDADGDTLTYTLGGTDAASFSIVGASGQIQTSAALNYEQKTSYSVTVSVADGEGGTDTIGVTISVTDESEPPDAPGAPTVAATSNTTTSLDVSWSAPDTAGRPAISDYDVQYRKSGDTAWTDHAHTGTSTTTTIGSLDSGTTYQVQVRATNAEGTSGWSATGTGSTDNSAPAFASDTTTRSVAENTASGANVGSAVTATDADGDTLTYSLGGTDAASFSIVGASGQIQTSAALNYEQKTSYSVTVSVADGEGGTDTIGVTISVTDVNEKPTTPGAPTVTATSNTTDSLDVSWTAPGLNGGPALTGYEVRYRISGSWIDWTHSGTGTSATITGLTASTTYDVQVRALNGETPSGWSATGTGSTGTPANNAPEFSDGASTARSVAENTASSSNVGSAVAATDSDGDTLTYTLGGTDAASFDITSTSGQIQTSAALDYEQKTSYSVTVSVADGEGGTDTIAVTISVTDVNEKPTTPGAPTVTATSNTTDSLDVSWTAPGLNGGPALTGYEVRYRISGSWIDWTHSGTGTSATITGLTASTTYDVQVRALNGETPSDWSSTGTGSTGTPANNAPEFSDGASTARSVAENTASSSNVGSAVTATDADGDTLTYTLGGTDAASFSIVGASGQIQTSAALNYEQKTSYSVTVSVADGEGGTDTIGVTISVTDESEPPDAPGAPTVAATSNTTTSLDVSWSAPDTAGRPAISDYDVQYRKSGDTAWTDHAHTGTSTTTTIGSLDSGTTYQVQVRATNAEGTSGWSATGTGSTDNSAPAFASDTTTRSVAENTASGANVGSAVTATDADGDTLTYSLGGTDAASFSIVGASGQIQTSAALNYEQKTSYSVTVSVADGEGGTDTIGVTISVTDVNEKPTTPGAPTVTATSNTTDSLDVSWTAPGLNGGPALTGYEVRYRISGSWIDWTHSGTGTSATITGLTASTTYDVQVRALNGETPSGWSATGTGSTGTPANNAPEFSDGASTARSVAENTASSSNVGSAVAATDADGDTLTYTLGGTDAASFDITSTSGQILTSAALDHETKSSYSVTVSVADGEGGTDTIGVTISVTDESEPPDAPGAPTVAATSNTTDSLDVSWSAPGLNGGPAISDYDVQYRKSGDTAWTDHAHTGTSTTTTIGSLDSGTTYQVQVRATNAEGTSGWSATGTGSTPEGPPDAPPTVQASGNAELTVTWDAPNDRGSGITGYTVQLKLSSVSGWPSGSVTERTLTGTPPARSHTFTGLTNGTEYTVRVKATNIHGDSDWSAEAGGTPSSKPPPSVTITTGADQPIDGPFAVTITFNEEVEGFACADEPPDPNEVACDIGAGYVGGALVDVVDLQEAGVNANGEHVFTARVEDILTGTLVVWVHKGKARAVDGGLPNAFDALQVEVKALDQVPQQPVTTVWQASMDVEDVGGYLGYAKAGGLSGGSLTGDTFTWSGQEYTVEALLYNQAIGEVILELSRALPNDGRRMALLIGNYWLDTSNPEPYTHTVAGKDGWGYRWHPVAPYLEAGHANVPVKLVRQAIGASSAQGQAFLSWGDPGDDTITGYRIERRDRDGDEGFTALVDDTGSDDTGYTDRSVEGGGRYAYRVTAMNDAGESEPSGEAHVDVPARPNSPARGAPTISGTAQVGETLTADTDGIEDDDGLADAVYSYQWLADDADISGATGETYTPAYDDERKVIRVKVSFADDRDFEETLTSEPTAAVEADPDAPTEPPNAPRTVRIVGDTNTSLTLTWDAPDGGTAVTEYRVQWLTVGEGFANARRDGREAVVDASARSHTITGLSEYGFYQVRVLAVNGAGESKGSNTAWGFPGLGEGQYGHG